MYYDEYGVLSYIYKLMEKDKFVSINFYVRQYTI